MKKFEEELEEELEKALNTPLQDETKPDLSKFDKALENNKKTRVKITYFRNIAVACVFVLLVTISCLIPVWMKDKDSDPEIVRYYGDNDTVQVALTETFVEEYINTNIPNYNFIFEECLVSKIFGIYDKETQKELLALDLQVTKNNTPITLIVNIILNKNYTYSQHSYHISNASTEKLENKTIYTKEVDVGGYTKYYVLIERPTYNTYLILNINDSETINKFTQN